MENRISSPHEVSCVKQAWQAARDKWVELKGCDTCLGKGSVSRNVSPTLDYTDFQNFDCDAPTCNARETGLYQNIPECQHASKLQESYAHKLGRWGVSLTTKGKACDKAGVIVELVEDRSKYGTWSYGKRALIACESGEAVWVPFDKLAIQPQDQGKAFAVLLMRCKTSEEVERLSHTASSDDERASAAVRFDQLSEREPKLSNDDYVFWAKSRSGDWTVKGPGLKLGKVPAKARDGRVRWVEVVRIERNVGFIAG